MNVLCVENLSKTFTIHNLGGKQLQGFRNVSFQVREGGALALFGPSGIGKSSVLKCIYRTYLPTSGHIWYHSTDGQRLDLAHLPEHDIIRLRRQEIGYVAQFLHVLPRVGAVDVVAEPLIKAGVPMADARRQAGALLTRLKIPQSLHDAYPVTFSGGEQQRVNIARAAIGQPRLLLLDEPTASLDVKSIRIVLDLLADLRQSGTTMVMICHDQAIAKETADILLPIELNRTWGDVSLPDEWVSRPKSNRGLLVTHADLVLPDRIARNTPLRIEDGKIAAIGESADDIHPRPPILDAARSLILPGFIDLHSDAIEKAIEPRPRAVLPLELALTELDKNLAACGITTMHHCISVTGRESNKLRHYKKAGAMIRRIRELSPGLLVDTRVHVRYEILDVECVPLLQELLEDGAVDLLSFMDHTPGQGQFSSTEYLYEYYTKAAHLSRDEVDAMIQRRLALSRNFDDCHLREIAQQCRSMGIPLASHDDDTAEKVAWMHGLGVGISEFPVTLEAARAAKEAGMHVLMGSPNILIGRSLTNNLSGRSAIEKGFCDLIGSDYSPQTLLHAVFALEREGIGQLTELVPMASANPARAVGRDTKCGTLAEGLAANFIMVDMGGAVPRITRSFRNGRQIYAAQ
jgi:alpha-D-ribose 1-methylphosphonate 5-triphosphate diphosphatase